MSTQSYRDNAWNRLKAAARDGRDIAARVRLVTDEAREILTEKLCDAVVGRKGDWLLFKRVLMRVLFELLVFDAIDDSTRQCVLAPRAAGRPLPRRCARR